jgi:hypothetical protein
VLGKEFLYFPLKGFEGKDHFENLGTDGRII